MITAYLAADGFIDQLAEELRRGGAAETRRHGRLIVCEGPPVPAAWSANTWLDCVELPVPSIGSAAQALRAIQRNWAMYAPVHHRRAALIAERLPHVSARPVVFPAAAPLPRSARGRCWHPTGCWRRRAARLPSPTARSPSSRTGPGRPTVPI